MKKLIKLFFNTIINNLSYVDDDEIREIVKRNFFNENISKILIKYKNSNLPILNNIDKNSSDYFKNRNNLIYELYTAGLSKTRISKMFNCTPSNINCICNKMKK